MSDILIFVWGMLTALLVVAFSVWITFLVINTREDMQIDREVKKKERERKVSRGESAVIRPKTIHERQVEEDDETQAFLGVLKDS